MTTCNKGVGRCFNNRITILTTIIYHITFFNDDRGQRRAIIERIISNTRYAIRDSDRSQTRAMRECITSNTCYTVGDSDRCQRRAIRERSIFNTRYAVRDSNRGQTRAIIERITSNTCNAVRDDCILAASNKRISSCFYNCIAIFATIVSAITAFNYHRGEGTATTESPLSNARDTIGDYNGGNLRT